MPHCAVSTNLATVGPPLCRAASSIRIALVDSVTLPKAFEELRSPGALALYETLKIMEELHMDSPEHSALITELNDVMVAAPWLVNLSAMAPLASAVVKL